MQAPSAIDLSRMSAPSTKGPPASFLPTPRSVQQMDSCAVAAAIPGRDYPMSPNQIPKIYKIRSPSDIDWSRPLKDQLAPQVKGGPDPSKPCEELCMLRSNVLKINDDIFQQIFPSDNDLCITQKTGGRHFVHLREAAAWIINGSNSLVQCLQATDDGYHMVSRLG